MKEVWQCRLIFTANITEWLNKYHAGTIIIYMVVTTKIKAFKTDQMNRAGQQGLIKKLTAAQTEYSMTVT